MAFGEYKRYMNRILRIALSITVISLFLGEPCLAENSNKESYSISLVKFTKNLSKSDSRAIGRAIRAINPDANLFLIKLKPLTGGISDAKIFKFEINNKQYVIRILDKKLKRETRRSEVDIQLTAASIGMAPKIFYIDSKENPKLIIMEFIDGREFSKHDFKDNKTVNKLINIIKSFHNCKANFISKKTRIERLGELYRKNIEINKVVYPSCFDELMENLKNNVKKFGRTTVQIHGDLHPKNILITKTGDIKLIDFSASHMDNPILDIVWFGCFSEATQEHVDRMLEMYLQKKLTSNERKEAAFYQNVINFSFAVKLIQKQKERSQKKLDEILNDSSLKRGSEYTKDWESQSHKLKNNSEFTRYSLSWIKEFKEVQSIYTY